jgi:hypothetical protein
MFARPSRNRLVGVMLAGTVAFGSLAIAASHGLPAVAALPVAAAPSAAPPGAGAFVQLAPTRILDTRSGSIIRPGGSIDVQVTGTLVPVGALAVALNLTIDQAVQPGYVTLYPTGGIQAGSNVNPTEAGQTVANMSIVSLPASGKVTAFVNSGGHVLLDVAGYWVAASASTSGRYSPVNPLRVLDTRNTTKPGPGAVVNATVTGGAVGVPADASAVAVTITASDATDSGFITAWPTGQTRPIASNVNLPGPGATVPNLAIVPVGAGGQISLYTDAGTDLIVDIAGWFSGAAAPSSSDGLFVPVQPTRIADSRSAQSIKKLVGGLPAELPVSIPGGVPAGSSVSSVALNLTVTDTFDDGFLTAAPAQVPLPLASNLNYTRGHDVASLSITRLGANGALNLSSYSGTHIIADIAGWFTGAPAADGGYRPTKCENLVVYTRDDGATNSIMVHDRTSTAPDRVIASDVNGYAQITPHCEYVLIADYDNAGEITLTRVDPLGSQPETLISGPTVVYSYVFSPDAKVIYARNQANSLIWMDAQTGAKFPLIVATVNKNWVPNDISPDGRYLDVIQWPDGDGVIYPNGWYRYDTLLRTTTLVDAAPHVVATHSSPNRQYTASLINPPETSPLPITASISPFGTVNPSGSVNIPASDVVWTPQGEAVTTEDTSAMVLDEPLSFKVRAAPFTTGTDLFTGTGSHLVPSFPTFALL